MDHAAALQLVYEAIDTVNELRPDDDQLPRQPDLKLAGQDGRLDSLALATLLLAVERRVEDQSGEIVTLLDESAADPDAQMALIETPDAIARLVLQRLGA